MNRALPNPFVSPAGSDQAISGLALNWNMNLFVSPIKV